MLVSFLRFHSLPVVDASACFGLDLSFVRHSRGSLLFYVASLALKIVNVIARTNIAPDSKGDNSDSLDPNSTI